MKDPESAEFGDQVVLFVSIIFCNELILKVGDTNLYENGFYTHY